MMEQENVSELLNSVLLEMEENNFSIFKKNRRQDLEQILKLDYREVPVEFPNLVFKRLVEKKGKNCPLPLISFCIQSLGYYFLKENGIDISVEIVNSRGSWGSAYEEGIELSRHYLSSLRKGKTEVLETLFHEINHEIQIKKKKNLDYSYCTYEWLQDTLLYAFIGNPYYSTNYERVSVENDSRIKGGVLAYRYLKEISPKTAEKMKKRIYRNAKEEVEKITSNRRVGLLFTTREELFDDLIKKKPEILKSYPLLMNFYEEDGTKKTLADVLLVFKGLKDQRKYYEVRYSKEELRELDDYKAILSKIAFYIQFLKNRISSYENTKSDYLSITTENIPFLEACAEDEWLEQEREYYLTKFEKKYVVLMHLGKLNTKLFGEDIMNSTAVEIENVERMCASMGHLDIFRRTIISLQRIWNQSIKVGLSRKIFLEEPIDNVDVALKQEEYNFRK